MLTHNRKAAGGFSGLFSKQNRHFPFLAAPIGLEITPFFLQGDFGTKRPCVQVTSLRPPINPHERYVCAGYCFVLERCLNYALVVIWSLLLQKHTKEYPQIRERAAGYSPCFPLVFFSYGYTMIGRTGKLGSIDADCGYCQGCRQSNPCM